jgi:Na+/melibiose symporter-like transporter
VTNPSIVFGGKAYTAPAREVWAWGMGAIACHLLIQTYGQASMIFTVGFGHSPVIISWCMMLPRVVDGILDPIIGHLSDETHTRWGRRKPYLVIGSVLGALFLMSVWWANPAWSHTAQFVYLLTFGTPDICDVDELENGQRREGLFTAVMGFMAKLEISLCFLLVGYVLSWSGLDTKLAAQPQDVLHRLLWLCVVPNVAFTLIGLVFTVIFPVTPDIMADVRRKLDARRLQKAAAGEPTDEVAEKLVHEHPEMLKEFTAPEVPQSVPVRNETKNHRDLET